jgi:hypothetical protein
MFADQKGDCCCKHGEGEKWAKQEPECKLDCLWQVQPSGKIEGPDEEDRESIRKGRAWAFAQASDRTTPQEGVERTTGQEADYDAEGFAGFSHIFSARPYG